uniref:Uncharacterized protein n=1 Tax=Palpitomonas bilix TaxID=652834 RepID=A0A7S3FZE6_9EUKA|mmetsp:Transcript_13160/g.34433  ORF Transcript_13160/g.34433 Transcript_13160/m.34433 type:complete len:286 (+) Transcript_13160:135-992(+)|eukprot:CAMPEP_0113866914 /NCGR_PEP_ID=MMETSP0780_2-20120614/133_1 /TAXON_ID=652834 /ORGANISM="Palpitomonas bilix" /LENGTH=285 /DNA_ID=CAMNT_0000851809 /DNA_START=137 /DNA_END=994 /DNA_ORIENTATION=+ /assembly_acc=CAM_ASM_000599
MEGDLLSYLKDGHFDGVVSLVKNKHVEKMSCRCKNGDPTPLHYACFYGTPAMIEMVASECPFDSIKLDEREQIPFHIVCSRGSKEGLEALLRPLPAKLKSMGMFKMMDKQGNTGLHLSVLHDRKDIALFLLDILDEACILHKNKAGKTACHLAATKGFAVLVQKMVKKATKVVDDVDRDGRTPLICCVMEDHANTADLLVRLGCDTKIQDRQGNDARKWAEMLELDDCINAIEQKRSLVVESPAKRKMGHKGTQALSDSPVGSPKMLEAGSDVRWINFDISVSEL